MAPAAGAMAGGRLLARLAGVLALAVGLVALMTQGAQAEAACRSDSVELRTPEGARHRFNVEIADTDETRARGLMFREVLPRSSGMLFVYDRPVRAAFWMENTLIFLDMIFVDAKGEVTSVHHRARPLDRTVIDGGPGVLAVLEINGGMAAPMGIVPGTVLRHPAFGADAAWPCEP